MWLLHYFEHMLGCAVVYVLDVVCVPLCDMCVSHRALQACCGMGLSAWTLLRSESLMFLWVFDLLGALQGGDNNFAADLIDDAP